MLYHPYPKSKKGKSRGYARYKYRDAVSYLFQQIYDLAGVIFLFVLKKGLPKFSNATISGTQHAARFHP